MKSRFVLAGVVLLVAQGALAQSTEEMSACVDSSNGVSTKMLECGKAQIDKWDTRLNAAYQTLLRRENGTRRLKLRAEQKAWLVHHLNETRRLASDPDTGSGAFMVSQGFELDDIAKRTLELEKRVRVEN